MLRHNLVDQYLLWVFPLVIGAGKRLLSEGTIPSGLRLVDSKVSTTGVVIGTYEPAGEIVTGSFALDWPRSESLAEHCQYTARFGVFNHPKRTIFLKYTRDGSSRKEQSTYGPAKFVAPGTIRTERVRHLPEEPGGTEYLEAIERMHPVGRLGEPEEVAKAILFLASEEASFITGVILPVGGGYLAQ
jgi:hypothetical protein